MPSKSTKKAKKALNTTDDTADLGRRISDAMNDDFLVMDGLNEDFDGILEASPEAFDTSFQGSQTNDRDHERPDRSRSPSPKRRRSNYTETKEYLDKLNDEYKLAMGHLALSMRRSEISRHEILRQKTESEARAKSRDNQLKQSSSTGSSPSLATKSPLNIGLEQSRQMLRAYMNQMKSGMF